MTELFAVDGTVNDEKLTELLAVGHETQHLDYKRGWDLSKSEAGRKSRLELAVCVAAFANTRLGGYIVVGADNDGSLDHDEPPIDPRQFDEANLSQIVESFISGTVTLHVKVHERAARLVAVIFVGPTQDRLPVIFTKEGTVEPQNPRSAVMFRPGQVYVRRGTKCVPAEHRDWAEVLARLVDQIRAEAREVASDEIQQIMAATPPTSERALRLAVDFDSEPRAFADTLAESAQSESFGRLLRRRVRATAWHREDPNDLSAVLPMLDRLFIAGAHAILEDDEGLLNTVLTCMVDLYRRPMKERAGDLAGALLWRTIAAGAMALGGLAVREEAWAFVGKLAMPPDLSPVREFEGSSRYQSWIRHASTMASRAHLLGAVDQPLPGALIRFARVKAGELPLLADDVTGGASFELHGPILDQDAVLDSLCQFDFLWCTLALLADPSHAGFQTLPGFATFYAHRTVPVIEQLVDRSSLRYELRTALEPEWANALIALDDVATRYGQSTVGWAWSMHGSPSVQQFIAEWGPTSPGLA
ncbi:helix-turn-helix domain-containing protein [Cellulomonas algicola]|uniref:AlbA family DNA-binding domain-containing protein n=1 Tax=Cellulomonas algicola TaxID=2071633 RepID=UPI001C3F581F|nr:ATP-binding protein [Cellulomonas algicola]